MADLQQCFILLNSEEDISHVLQVEPNFPASQIFISSDHSCLGKMKAANNGRAVDVILSDLAANLAIDLWCFLRPGGRFINIKKRDNTALPIYSSEIVRQNCSYHAFDFEEFARATPEQIDR